MPYFQPERRHQVAGQEHEQCLGLGNHPRRHPGRQTAADALSSATRDYLTGGGASGRQQPNAQMALGDNGESNWTADKQATLDRVVAQGGMSEEDYWNGEQNQAQRYAANSTPFWESYAKCLQALISGDKRAVTVGALKGQEKYWASYIALMNAAMSGEGLEKAIQAVDESFAERNRDSSIADDSYEIEGTAQHPARWDFRKEAILIAVQSMS